MQIDFTAQLSELSGEPMTYQDEGMFKSGKAPMPLTLRLASCLALALPIQDASEIQKLQRFSLSNKIWNAEGLLDLTAEDVVEVKAAINRFFISPILMGQCYRLLDGTSAPSLRVVS